MKSTDAFNRWYSERIEHSPGVQLGKSAVEELTEENKLMREALEEIKQSIFSMKTNAHTFSNENLEEVVRESRVATELIDSLLIKEESKDKVRSNKGDRLAQLKDRVNHLECGLMAVGNPRKFLKEQADLNGYDFDCESAIKLSNNADWIKSLANSILNK